MRNKIFIPSKKIVLFEDAILFVEYKDGYHREAGCDEYGNPHNAQEIESRLNIVTKASEIGTVDGYDGAFKGCATQSAVITVRGDEADAIYAYLKYGAREIYEEKGTFVCSQ